MMTVSNPIIGILNQRSVERFWSKVERRSDDECWPWLASVNKDGYGRFKVASYIMARAHRVALIIATEEEHLSLLALHSCDNPPCCNPAHLRWGTPSENSKDMTLRNRHKSPPQAGFMNHNAKIQKDDLGEIIRLLQEGKNNKQIAETFGVNHATISLIRRGKTFAHEAMKLGWVPTPKFTRKSLAGAGIEPATYWL